MRSHEELTACKRGPFAVPVTIFLSLMRSYSKIKCLVITEYVESSANFQVRSPGPRRHSRNFKRRPVAPHHKPSRRFLGSNRNRIW
jgi:hypothetical protein